MNPDVLIQLLRDLHQELTTCLEFEPVDNVREPILLGDFIVETYNTYLSHVKTICEEDPLIDTLKDMKPWDPNQGGVEKNTKTAKMREVLFATQTLLTLLEQDTAAQQAQINNELLGVMSLLTSLGKQIQNPSKLDLASLKFLVTEYNRCLSLVQQAIDEPFMGTLFQPLETSDDAASTKMMLQFAHRSLQDYLKKRSRQKMTIDEAVASDIRGDYK